MVEFQIFSKGKFYYLKKIIHFNEDALNLKMKVDIFDSDMNDEDILK